MAKVPYQVSPAIVRTAMDVIQAMHSIRCGLFNSEGQVLVEGRHLDKEEESLRKAACGLLRNYLNNEIILDDFQEKMYDKLSEPEAPPAPKKTHLPPGGIPLIFPQDTPRRDRDDDDPPGASLLMDDDGD